MGCEVGWEKSVGRTQNKLAMSTDSLFPWRTPLISFLSIPPLPEAPFNLDPIQLVEDNLGSYP